MSNSLRDQLLKAGLVTHEQVEQAGQKKNRPAYDKRKPHAHKKQGAHAHKSQAHKNRPAKNGEQTRADNTPQPASRKKSANNSDLARFYQEKAAAEQAEREAEEKRRREAAAIKKRTRQQIRKLILDNLQNREDAAIRYNFVIETSIKYVFVTEEQQNALADGSLSITFMDGKRCLIPTAVAQEIKALDPNKIIVINEGNKASGNAQESEEGKNEATLVTPPASPLAEQG